MHDAGALTAALAALSEEALSLSLSLSLSPTLTLTLTRYALALWAAGIGTLNFVKQTAEAIEAQARCTPRRRAAASRSMAGSVSSARRAWSPSATAQATQRVPG